MNLKFHRLKIVEQIALVFFFAVIIPMSVSGFIINNINQQAVRAQLRDYAIMMANVVSDEIDFYSSNILLGKALYEQLGGFIFADFVERS